MITWKDKRVAVAADGTEHATMEDAQAHDLSLLFSKRTTVANAPRPTDTEIAQYIVSHSSEVLDILITDGRKRKRLAKSPAKPRKKSAHEQAAELMNNAVKQALGRPTTPTP